MGDSPKIGISAPQLVSIILPSYNEEDNISRCVTQLADCLRRTGHPFEIVIVNDGSNDRTLGKARILSGSLNYVRVVDLPRNQGKPTALREGIRHSRGQILAFFDADLQYDPEELPRLVKMIRNGVDLVNGRRNYALYGISRTVFSIFYNKLLQLLFRVDVHDSNCGLKVLSREAADCNSLFNYGLAMLVPVLKLRGFSAKEALVSLRQRTAGKSKYFEDGHFLGGRKNLKDISFNSMMLVKLFTHIPLEWKRRPSKTRNLTKYCI